MVSHLVPAKKFTLMRIIADLELLKEDVKYAKRMAQNEPLKSLIAREIDPGCDIGTDDQIRGTSIRHDFCKV